MPTGVPHTLKCPKCKRGKWGYEWKPIVKGLRVDYDRIRDRWGGSYRRIQTFVACLDCGHTWWTTLFHTKALRERHRSGDG